MSAVWVVREDGEVEAAFAREGDAIDYRQRYGAADMTVTRETLLTPEQAAVIAAALAVHEYGSDPATCDLRHMSYNEAWLDLLEGLGSSVTNLRAQEGE